MQAAKTQDQIYTRKTDDSLKCLRAQAFAITKQQHNNHWSPHLAGIPKGWRD